MVAGTVTWLHLNGVGAGAHIGRKGEFSGQIPGISTASSQIVCGRLLGPGEQQTVLAIDQTEISIDRTNDGVDGRVGGAVGEPIDQGGRLVGGGASPAEGKVAHRKAGGVATAVFGYADIEGG